MIDVLSTTVHAFCVRDEHGQITDAGLIYPEHIPDMVDELYTPKHTLAITLASIAIH